jgi:hypothetical protein
VFDQNAFVAHSDRERAVAVFDYIARYSEGL